MSRTRSLVKSQARKNEQRQIPRLLSKLEPYSDGPDIPDSERSFLSNKHPVIPWLMPIFSNGVHDGVLHVGGGLGWISRAAPLSDSARSGR